MLYDPNWDRRDVGPVLSDAALIAWLAAQRAEDPYSYSDGRHCLLALYFKAMGFAGVTVGPHTVSCGSTTLALPPGWSRVARGSEWDPVWTMGAAHARAIKHLSETQ